MKHFLRINIQVFKIIPFEEQLSYIGNDLKRPHIEGAEVIDIHLEETSITNIS